MDEEAVNGQAIDYSVGNTSNHQKYRHPFDPLRVSILPGFDR